MVNSQVKKEFIKIESKEFAFTKLMICGLCGSGITADEKFKKLKNGTVNKYIYYHCNRSKDRNCKVAYIREEELIKQFEKLIDQVDINKIDMKEKIRADIERITGFMKFMLNQEKKIETNDIDVRNYAKYVLKYRSNFEKRELLGCLKSKILLKNKKIELG